jgi:hypothetical protein
MSISEGQLFYATRSVPERIVQAHMTETVLLERISELVRWRRHWYRQQPRRDFWWDLAQRNDAELRHLLRVARIARRLAAAEPDPIDVSKRWHEYLDR